MYNKQSFRILVSMKKTNSPRKANIACSWQSLRRVVYLVLGTQLIIIKIMRIIEGKDSLRLSFFWKMEIGRRNICRRTISCLKTCSQKETVQIYSMQKWYKWRTCKVDLPMYNFFMLYALISPTWKVQKTTFRMFWHWKGEESQIMTIKKG